MRDDGLVGDARPSAGVGDCSAARVARLGRARRSSLGRCSAVVASRGRRRGRAWLLPVPRTARRPAGAVAARAGTPSRWASTAPPRCGGSPWSAPRPPRRRSPAASQARATESRHHRRGSDRAASRAATTRWTRRSSPDPVPRPPSIGAPSRSPASKNATNGSRVDRAYAHAARIHWRGHGWATYRTWPRGVWMSRATAPWSAQRTRGGAGISTRSTHPHAKRASNAI